MCTFFLVAPKVTLHQCSTPVIEGDNATLGCNATGNPVPSIEWIMESTLEVISNDSLLILSNISRNDGGAYLCLAKNIIGNDTKNCTVDVLCKFIRCSQRLPWHTSRIMPSLLGLLKIMTERAAQLFNAPFHCFRTSRSLLWPLKWNSRLLFLTMASCSTSMACSPIYWQ